MQTEKMKAKGTGWVVEALQGGLTVVAGRNRGEVGVLASVSLAYIAHQSAAT